MWITTFTTVSDKLPHGEIMCDIESIFLLPRPLCSALASGTDSSDYEEVWYKWIVLYLWRRYFIQWHHQAPQGAANWELTQNMAANSIWVAGKVQPERKLWSWSWEEYRHGRFSNEPICHPPSLGAWSGHGCRQLAQGISETEVSGFEISSPWLVSRCLSRLVAF